MHNLCPTVYIPPPSSGEGVKKGQNFADNLQIRPVFYDALAFCNEIIASLQTLLIKNHNLAKIFISEILGPPDEVFTTLLLSSHELIIQREFNSFSREWGQYQHS